MTGAWPNHDIDHIDGDKANNKWLNLRDATGVNAQNLQQALVTNTSGLIGAHTNDKGRSFFSAIKVGGVVHRLGQFPTAELAHAAYIEAKRRLHPGNML